MKRNLLDWILAIIITAIFLFIGFRFFYENPPVIENPLVTPTADAAISFDTSSYASTTYNITTGNVTVFAWVNKNSDTDLDFAWGQKTTLDNQNMQFIQRGAAAGNNQACQGLTGTADFGVKPDYGKWQFIACVFDGTNMMGYDFRVDGTLRATSTAVATRTGTEDGFVIGSVGTNNWNGAVRGLTVVDAVLTQAQLQKIVLSRNPYSVISQIELYCPLTSGTDNRCWTGSKQISLTMFNSPSFKVDPPTTPFPF